ADELSWAASVNAEIWPVGSVGMKPFGIATKSQAVNTKVRSITPMTVRRCASTHRSVQSYVWSMPSKKRSETAYSRECDWPGGRRNRLHAMGVSVNDTKPDTSTATV